MPAASKSTVEILDVDDLRGQVVTIQLAPLSAASEACIGWSALKMLGAKDDAGSQTGARGDGATAYRPVAGS